MKVVYYVVVTRRRETGLVLGTLRTPVLDIARRKLDEVNQLSLEYYAEMMTISEELPEKIRKKKKNSRPTLAGMIKHKTQRLFPDK